MITNPLSNSGQPGAFSSNTVDNSGGAPNVATGILFLLGEATTGAPGSSAGLRSFGAAQFSDLVKLYTAGPLVDDAFAALTPSRDANVSGYSTVVCWKTNASTQASLQLQNGSSQNLILLQDPAWGLPGNYITILVQDGSSPSLQKILTFTNQKTGVTEVMPQNAAQVQLTVHYIGAGSACTATIFGASETAKTLATTATGASGDNLSLTLSQYSIKDLVNYFNTFNGGASYAAVLSNAQTGTIIQATELDPVTALDIKTGVTSMYRLQNELVQLVNANSKLVIATKNGIHPGIIADISATYMAGGATGASASSDFSTGMTKSLGIDYNVIVPCISSDATADITAGLTDASSAYVSTSVQAALLTHLLLRGNIKNRREAQGVVGFRNSTIANVYTQCQALNTALVQLVTQDVQITDNTATTNWKYPHTLAAMIGGMRCGVDQGEPLTNKSLNCSGVGHAVNFATNLPGGDFDPSTAYDAAIAAGMTFASPADGGGFWVDVDNTTYGVDQNFVWNRGSVVQAVQYINKVCRASARALYVGRKVSAGRASSVKKGLKDTLRGLLEDDVVLSATDQYPLGYDDKSFSVIDVGNTLTVKLRVIPIQGGDFVNIFFTLGNIIQTGQ